MGSVKTLIYDPALGEDPPAMYCQECGCGISEDLLYQMLDEQDGGGDEPNCPDCGSYDLDL